MICACGFFFLISNVYDGNGFLKKVFIHDDDDDDDGSGGYNHHISPLPHHIQKKPPFDDYCRRCYYYRHLQSNQSAKQNWQTNQPTNQPTIIISS